MVNADKALETGPLLLLCSRSFGLGPSQEVFPTEQGNLQSESQLLLENCCDLNREQNPLSTVSKGTKGTQKTNCLLPWVLQPELEPRSSTGAPVEESRQAPPTTRGRKRP